MNNKSATDTETVTITFGDCGENGVGMEKIQITNSAGATGAAFDLEDLEKIKSKFEERECQCELVELHTESGLSSTMVEPAYLLIVRNGLASIIDNAALFSEQLGLEWDSKCYMRGRVVNKHARHNLCFADYSQEPDYESKKGRIYAFSSLPYLEQLKKTLENLTERQGLVAEGNRYFDVSKCGIGFHGDAERKLVIAVRLGCSMPLHYQWYHRFKPQGKRMDFTLNHGDIYFMSHKAVGTDWRKSSIFTLRHAAGSTKYTKITSEE